MNHIFWRIRFFLIVFTSFTCLFYACNQKKIDEKKLLTQATQVKDSVISSLEASADSIDPNFEPSIKSELWTTLLNIEYEKKGVYGYIPQFTEEHQVLNQKEIILKGYMYPLEAYEEQNFFMLSSNPLNACFFCGGSGPESVVEVNSPKGIPLKEGIVTIKGILHLNSEEPERLFYILNEAVMVQN